MTTTYPQNLMDGIRQMKRRIAEGHGRQQIAVSLVAIDGTATPHEDTVEKLYSAMVAMKKREIVNLVESNRQSIERFKADTAYRDPNSQWVAQVGAPAMEARRQLLEFPAEFAAELEALDTQIDEIVTLIHVPFTESAGAGKLRMLDERRVARDPHTEIRDFPLPGKMAREINADTRELVTQITGKPLGKVMEELMDREYPDLMRAFYPRIYENTGRYHSPRACAGAVVNIIAETLRYGYHKTATAYRLAMPGLAYLRQHRVPMFFLAPDLMEAVLRTDFDDDINWQTMELPYESGILMLPKGSLVHPEDGEVAMLMWSRIRKGEHAPPWPGIPRPILPHDAFIILGLCADRCVWFDSILTANVRPVMRLNNLFYRAPGEAAPNIEKSNFMDADLTEDEQPFVEKMGVILFGTFLAMNARPVLVEHGKLLKRVGAGAKAREFWSPNVIGARYKFKREVAKIVDRQFVTSTRATGTHASPRMHWRRGHYRNQPYGPKLKEHKTIWIEPCLIGAEG